MEARTKGFEIVRNTKTDVGLDAWRRLNTVAGKIARADASWLFRRGCKHGETGARAASCSPEVWRRCSESLEIDTHGAHPENLSEDPP